MKRNGIYIVHRRIRPDQPASRPTGESFPDRCHDGAPFDFAREVRILAHAIRVQDALAALEARR